MSTNINKPKKVLFAHKKNIKKKDTKLKLATCKSTSKLGKKTATIVDMVIEKKALSDVQHIALCLARDKKEREEQEKKKEAAALLKEELELKELNKHQDEPITIIISPPRVKIHPKSCIPLTKKHYEKPYNVHRRAKLILFISCFDQHKEFWQLTRQKQIDLIEKIERSCMNYSIMKANEENIPTIWMNELFQDLYHSMCAKISANITPNNGINNTYLPKLIFEKKIDINTLPKLSSQELFPAKYRDIIIKIEASKNVSHTVKTSAMYKCRRCHQSKCTITNRYNRSLDEGVNLTITCEVCRNEWNA